jgi:hypothetical protein
MSIIADFHPASKEPPLPEEWCVGARRKGLSSRALLLKRGDGRWACGRYARFDDQHGGVFSEELSGTTLHDVVGWAVLP